MKAEKELREKIFFWHFRQAQCALTDERTVVSRFLLHMKCANHNFARPVAKRLDCQIQTTQERWPLRFAASRSVQIVYLVSGHIGHVPACTERISAVVLLVPAREEENPQEKQQVRGPRHDTPKACPGQNG
jgi:hypothetical protein